MNYYEALKVSNVYLLPLISNRYDLKDYTIKPVSAHVGGRNIIFTCEKEGSGGKIIRIVYLNDRSREDVLGEVEYIRYLYENGGNVSNVVDSKNGNLLEEISHANRCFYVCLFEKAKGEQLAENGYRYREGVPIKEYFFNCGKVLGKIHQLSKMYVPIRRRYSFFDKYNPEYINKLLPGSLSLLKEKIFELLKALNDLEKNSSSFGMVHFDFSDSNYMIDYDTGDITVYDFDNSCFCWYMYDLTTLWTHGVGWIQFEPDAQKRRKFMDDYFNTVLTGYKSETDIELSLLEKLPLFIKVTILENIVDYFEVTRNNGEEPECDEELSFLIKCLEDDIPYKGFFSEIYSFEEPFEYETRIV